MLGLGAPFFSHFFAVTTCGLLTIRVWHMENSGSHSKTIAAITVCNSVISHTNLHNGNRSSFLSVVPAKLGKHGKKSCQLLIEVKTTITTALFGRWKLGDWRLGIRMGSWEMVFGMALLGSVALLPARWDI